MITDANRCDVKLADANLKIDIDGNVHIGIVVTEYNNVKNSKLFSFDYGDIKIQHDTPGNWELVIPGENINLNLDVNVNAKNISINKMWTASITFNYSTINTVSEKYSSKLTEFNETITLDEKKNENGKLGLWTYIDDISILKKHGWLKTKTLTNHKDGSLIDKQYLALDKISNSIKEKEDEILGVRVYVYERNPANENYKGKYYLYVDLVNKKAPYNDIYLETKTIKLGIMDPIDKISLNPLVINVPNAYVINTLASTENNKAINLDTNTFNKRFAIGTQGASSTDWQTVSSIWNSKQYPFFKFTKQLDIVAKNNSWYNGVLANYEQSYTSDSVNYLKTSMTLKNGFAFKKDFTGINNQNYATSTSNKIDFLMTVTYSENNGNGSLFYANSSLDHGNIDIVSYQKTILDNAIIPNKKD